MNPKVPKAHVVIGGFPYGKHGKYT